MTSDPLILPIIVRMVTAAMVVVMASLASERAGPFWGAMIVSLPVSAGPAYVLLAMAQDAAFVGASALTSLASLAAAALYLLVYAKIAPRHGTAVSVAAALATWLIGVLLIRELPWTALTATAINLIVFSLCVLLTRNVRPGAKIADGAARQWFDLPLRALGVGVLVATVVTASSALGATVTGIAAVFPIAVTSLGLTMQPRLGGQTTAATMASALRAMPGIGMGFLVLHLMAEPYGSPIALTAALIASLVWPVGLIVLRARSQAAAA